MLRHACKHIKMCVLSKLPFDDTKRRRKVRQLLPKIKIRMRILVFFVLCVFEVCVAEDVPFYKRVRDCLGQGSPVVCLKMEALDILNQTIMSDQPLTIYDTIDIVKDSNYAPNYTDETLPEDSSEKSAKLNELLYNKVEEFIQSRTLRLNLGNVIEGRKKGGGGGGKGGKMSMALMMGAVGMAGMMAHLFMGKIAFLAGAALLIAKLALFLSAITSLKKMSGGGGGGGGETQHVVYAAPASSGDYGHSHGGGGGGWHRSLSANEHAQDVVYRAHITTPENFAYKK